MSKTVSTYNFETNRVSFVPASELAPGMIEAEVAGVGRVWVSILQLKGDRSFRHPPFGEKLRDCLRQIKEVIDEVYPQTLLGWENGFRRDSCPEAEIAVWLRIAAIYRRCTEGRSLPYEHRLDFFRVLLACSLTPREQLFEALRLEAISRQEAEAAVELYFSPPEAGGT